MPIHSDISNIPDRFIPQRSRLDFELSNYKLTKDEYEKPLNALDQKPKDYYRRNYVKALWSTLHKKNTKVISWDENEIDQTDHYKWPVHPRNKSLITSPDLILDLPSLNTQPYRNAVDWSRKGHLASIFNNTVYLWYCPTISRQNTQDIIKTRLVARRALKWNHSGYNMAVAASGFIRIWSFQANKLIAERKCRCHVSDCIITVICWASDDRFLATGCNRGTITVWTNELLKLNQLNRAHLDCVKTLCLSPGDKTLCSTSLDFTVRIWKWPNLEVLLILNSQSHVQTVEYHPWDSSLLAVGGNELSLWNINSHKRLDVLNYSLFSNVDCLTWNPLTGELVVGHTLCQGNDQSTYEDEYTGARLTVLSNFGKAVDTLVKHVDSIIYLKWNPDYTELATGSMDESLCIWNFFGSESKKYKKKYLEIKNQRKYSSQTLSLYKSIR